MVLSLRRARTLTSLAVAGALTLAGAAAAAPAQAAPTDSTRVSSITAGPSTVVKYGQITVAGGVQKYTSGAWRASAGAPVAVYFDPAGTAPNALVRTVKSATNGTYSTRFTATRSGVWTVRSAATTTLKASAVSARRTVTVVTSRAGTARPASPWTCPSWAPIKGNASSGIFHRPGQRYYAVTKPEVCFVSSAAAVANGYRAAKV
ncbi:hypothetical protein [Tersicoccus sp. Bi-70]|uniref:sunset domain-containing protein n=1 Tax=Tersicoccus sp. Bi-70 TaxID=1897634 RepID=UPI0009769C0B|nr:hypothetical protein [Tersicoccus sp. Bi-70]OMH31340.1 hypothetical protein BGP79_09995 [Tersicoccus sp. Bi-70]